MLFIRRPTTVYMRLAPLLWGETKSMQKSVISSDYAPCLYII